jgi:hypothetical protein
VVFLIFIKITLAITIMEEFSKDMELLVDKTTLYVRTSYNLFRLKAILKASEIVSSIVIITISSILLLAIMVFLSIALSQYIGNLLGETYYGYLVVSGGYIVILMLLKIFFYRIIKRKIQNNIIKKMLK